MLKRLLKTGLPITVLLCISPVRAFCEGLPQGDQESPAMLMALEIQLDRSTVFKTTFPVSYAESSTIAESPRQTISFSIKPQRSILWMRELRHTVTPIITQPNQEITGSIWTYSVDDGKYPGASSDWFAIGGSFSTDHKLLVNRVHVAHPKRRDRSEIAAGLVILTYPVKREE
jgi:hypothetical protein